MLSFSKELPITKEVAQKNNNQHSDSGQQHVRPQHADGEGQSPQSSQYAPGATMLQRLSDDAEFHRLVDTIYEAVLDPAQMPTALALLSVYAGAESAHYFVWDKQADAPREGVSSGWCQHCPQPGDCNTFCQDPQLLHAPQAEDTPARGVTLMDTPDLCITMRLRTRDGISEVSAAEREERLQRVLPHLQRAARMQQRNQELNELAALGMAGLDTLDFGVMVIERSMRVKYANAWARTMATEDDRLSLDGSMLHSADHTHNAALRNLIEHAAGSMGVQGAAGSWMYLARDGRPVPFIATPLAPSDAMRSTWAAPLALVLVGNSEARSVMDAGVLASLFGLTNKECIVAARLAAGETLQEIADREFLSLHTVRVHIRDILRKTGTHRQSELVSLLHLLPSVDLERAGAATPASRRRTRLNA
ncbi:helix-turn-helix transcriptional regulator [Ralstonia insidiosa]|uniref:helix-turn-helix transcriptional regulator n=1 Tax=Ralstonia TaxID=48736 RepID=UPI00066E3201|nr:MULTISPECIES: helix-turn-helix transcriptional regulator [Ralstonia]MBY4705628.1 helix-turn-helix transcriptional regulator [Ralstonia insidiosa]GAQ29859.1 luxR family transcrptional regulator [Ralstonia sp. NT80]